MYFNVKEQSELWRDDDMKSYEPSWIERIMGGIAFDYYSMDMDTATNSTHALMAN